jgi:hypothetical protein
MVRLLREPLRYQVPLVLILRHDVDGHTRLNKIQPEIKKKNEILGAGMSLVGSDMRHRQQLYTI